MNIPNTATTLVARINHDYCVSCGACVPRCPVNAIYELNDNFYIDEYLCEGLCGQESSHPCINVCPVDAIYLTLVYPS